MKKPNLFSLLVLSVALVLSSCAAYYSVSGIANLFSGAIVSVGIMMGTLEIAKLVCSNFLFRYWQRCKWLLRIYMLCGVILLMLITSTGIGGALISAYQKSEIQNRILTQKIELIENQKQSYSNQIQQIQSQINLKIQLRNSQEKRLNDALQNETISKNIVQLQEVQSQSAEFMAKTELDISDGNKKIQDILIAIQKLDTDEFNIKLESYQHKDILTFQFVADMFGTSISKVVKWLIIVLIFVFDPLAVCMLMAYNTIVLDRNDEPGSVSNGTPVVSDGVVSPKSEPLYKKILRKPFNRFHGR